MSNNKPTIEQLVQYAAQKLQEIQKAQAEYNQVITLIKNVHESASAQTTPKEEKKKARKKAKK